jgi:hypothetical protein
MGFNELSSLLLFVHESSWATKFFSLSDWVVHHRRQRRQDFRRKLLGALPPLSGALNKIVDLGISEFCE